MSQQTNNAARHGIGPKSGDYLSLGPMADCAGPSSMAIPSGLLSKWQEDMELAYDITNLSASLIRQDVGGESVVLLTSSNLGNAFEKGQKLVLKSGASADIAVYLSKRMLVTNSADVPEWMFAPDTAKKPDFFLSLPLLWPNGQFFAVLCLTSSNVSFCPEHYIRLLEKFQRDIELDLRLLTQTSDLNQTRDQLSVVEEELEKQAYKQVEELLVNSHALESEVVKCVRAEKNYRELFNFAPDAMFLIDDEAKIVLVNKYACELFAYSHEELSGRNLNTLVSSSVLQKIFSECAKKTGDIPHHTLTHHGVLQVATKYGRQFPVQLSFSRLTFDQRNLISVIVRDVSEQEDSRLILEESEQSFRILFDEVTAGVAILDMDANILDVNRAFCNALGYDKKELIGNYIREFNNPDERNGVVNEYKQLIAGEIENYVVDRQYMHKDGHDVWLQIKVSALRDKWGRCNRIMVYMLDVTRPKEMQAELRKQHGLLNSIIEGTDDSIFVKDRNGHYQLINSAGAGYMGLSKEEIVGKSEMDLLGEEAGQVIAEKDEEIFARGKIITLEEYIVTDKKQGFWWHTLKGPVRDECGEVVGIFGIARNITERKKIENELHEKDALYRQAEQLGQLGYWECDEIRGGLIACSEEYARIFGMTVNEVLQAKSDIAGRLSLIHPDDQDYLQQVVRESAQIRKTSLDIEYRVLSRYGAVRHVHELGKLEYDGEGTLVRSFGILQDITRRKNTEQQLQLSNSLYEQAELLGGIGYWEWDTENKRLRNCSEQFARIFGLTRSEVLKYVNSHKSLLEYIHPDDLEYFLEAVETFRQQRDKLDAEYRIINAQGETKYVHVLSEVIKFGDDQEPKVFGVLQDITERRLTDLALRKSEERYRLLVETMTHGLGIIDIEGRFTFVNDRLCEMLVYTREELLGMPIVDLLDRCNKKILLQQIEERKQGKYAPYEMTWTRKDGEEVASIVGPAPLIDAEGVYCGSFATVTDITERKNAEEQLQIYKHIVSSTSEFMTYVDTEHVFRAINKKYLQVFSKREDEIVGHHVAELHGPERYEQMIAPGLKKAFAGEEVTAGYWTELVPGEACYLESIYTPSSKENGDIAGVVVSTRDLTNLKRMQEQLERHQQQLELQVQQRTSELSVANEELEAFAHTISHDLKAPLRAVDGFAEWLIEDYAPDMDEQGRAYLMEIQKVASRMGRMIDELLMHARLGERFRIKEAVDLNEVLSQVKTDLAGEINASEAEVFVTGKLPVVEGHRATLEILLRNLLSNAMKFVAAGTKPVVTVTCQEMETYYEIFVQDNGIGIDDAHKDMIFNIFERLHSDDEFTGTGVGLAIAKKAVLLHNGQIGVNSQPGEGSTFHFTLGKGLESTSDNYE